MREIGSLKELVTTRLDGMDKAVVLLQAKADRSPSIDEIVAKYDEKFSAVTQMFAEREKRADQLVIADKMAVSAALKAQNDAAAKTEENFSKLIEQQQALLTAETKNTDGKINDIKSRLDKGEGRLSVADPAATEAMKLLTAEVRALLLSRDTLAGQATGQKDYTALIVSIGGVVIMAIPVIVLVLKSFGH
jgi:hypothetical protein